MVDRDGTDTADNLTAFKHTYFHLSRHGMRDSECISNQELRTNSFNIGEQVLHCIYIDIVNTRT